LIENERRSLVSGAARRGLQRITGHFAVADEICKQAPDRAAQVVVASRP